MIFAFVSMLLFPLAIEENREFFLYDPRDETYLVHIYGQEGEFSPQEIIEPLLDVRDSLNRV